MDRRDRAVAGGLALALAAIVAAIAVPALLPSSTAAEVVASPSPAVVAPYREGVVGRPVSISPLTARSQADQALVGLVFAGLLRLGPGDTLRPDLAEWWRAEDDGAAWLVRISEDARWQDGEPVTATDVAYTAAALADPALAAPQGSSWAQVQVEVVDERTVRFRLNEPLGGFPWLLTQPLAPAHLLSSVPLDALADDPFGRAPVGAGPFRLRELTASSAVLEAAHPEGGVSDVAEAATDRATSRPSRPTPWLDELELVFFEDAASLASALGEGAIDGAVGLASDASQGDAAAGDLRTIVYPGTTLSTILFDLRPDNKELRDARVRTALLAAIDIDAIVGSRAVGPATRADSPIPPSSTLFDPSASPAVAFDRAAARKLLADAGWKRLESKAWAAPDTTKGFRLSLLVPPAGSAPHLAATAKDVAANWTEFGIRTTVEEVAFDKLVERLHGGDFKAALVDVAIGHDPDLYPLMASSQVVSSGLNVSAVQDAKLDARLAAARRATGDVARKAAYAELQTYLARQRYLGTLYFRDLPFTVSERLDGPTSHQLSEVGERYWDVLTWRLASGR